MPTPLHMLPLSAGHASEVARPLEDFIYLNTNYKYGFSYPSYVSSLSQNLPADLLSGVRESAMTGVPASTATNPKPAWPWNGALAYFRDIHNPTKNPWMIGRKLLINPGASFVHEGPVGQQYQESTWGDYIRWRVHQFSLPFPTADDVIGWLHPNECDNKGMTYDTFVRDAPANEPEVAMDRNILLARMVWQELRAGPHMYRTGPHPGFIIGPTISRGTKAATQLGQALGNQFSIWQLLTRNNGEILDYFDAIACNQHQVHSRIESFANVGPLEDWPSFYWAWKAIHDANAARVAAGRPARPMALCTTEAGMSTELYAGQYIDRVALRGYRTGVEFCMMHWFGISLWSAFSFGLTGSEDDGFDYTSGTDGTPKADWPVFLDIIDFRKYDIDLFSSDLPAKGWEDFNKAYTWAVYIPQSFTEAGVTSGNPAPTTYWGRVTFPGGRIEMGPGDRNLVLRPIYLRSLRPHRLSVEVQTTGSAKLRARGYDKLDGLAEVSATTTGSSWQTLDVVFTPRQHNVPNLPNPCYVLFCLDHNGTGTATFRNPRITVL